jgi:hypothetical protein
MPRTIKVARESGLGRDPSISCDKDSVIIDNQAVSGNWQLRIRLPGLARHAGTDGSRSAEHIAKFGANI